LDAIWVALIALAALVGVAVVIGGGVTLLLRARGQATIDLNPRVLLRIYLLVAILAGLLIFTQGTANLLQAALAEVDGKQFSYAPVFVAIPADEARRTPTALELKDRDQLTPRSVRRCRSCWLKMRWCARRRRRNGGGWGCSGPATKG